MITLCSPDWGKKTNGPFNLVSDHCYTVTGLHTDTSDRKFFDLSNPWGFKDVSVPWDQFRSFCDGIRFAAP